MGVERTPHSEKARGVSGEVTEDVQTSCISPERVEWGGLIWKCAILHYNFGTFPRYTITAVCHNKSDSLDTVSYQNH